MFYGPLVPRWREVIGDGYQDSKRDVQHKTDGWRLKIHFHSRKCFLTFKLTAAVDTFRAFGPRRFRLLAIPAWPHIPSQVVSGTLSWFSGALS
jgi:hypothetical protein